MPSERTCGITDELADSYSFTGGTTGCTPWVRWTSCRRGRPVLVIATTSGGTVPGRYLPRHSTFRHRQGAR